MLLTHHPVALAGCLHQALRIEHRNAPSAIADETRLLEWRGVGRAQLPSTTLGLLFHAAEHTQRHVGQMVTTAKIVKRMFQRGTVNDRVATAPSAPSAP